MRVSSVTAEGVSNIAAVWSLIVLGALLTGAACVAILVVKRELETLAAVVGVAAFALAIYALGLVARTYERIDAVVYAFAFLMAGAAGGWALSASVLERLGDEPEPLSPPERITANRDGAAVILFSCIETHEYRLTETARTLRRLGDDELVEISLGALPFLFFAQKARYRALGGRSPAYPEFQAITDKLSRRVQHVDRFEFATCSGDSMLPALVLRTAQAGYKTIIVAEVAVGDSLGLSEAKRLTDALRLEEHGVRVVYTPAIGQSDRIVSMLVQRVLQVTEDPNSTGVVLLGHGQPDVRARKNPGYDEQENALLNRVRMQLADAGLNENMLRIAWAEWRVPDITSSVRHLAALGCGRIVVVPGTFPLDTIATRLDVELAVRQARVDPSVLVVTLPAWSDDPRLIDELAERIETELPALHH